MWRCGGQRGVGRGTLKGTGTMMAAPQRFLNEMRTRFPERSVALAQAAYYTPTGIWPIFHVRSFEWITGPKTDTWLVKTVGALLAVTGGALGLAAARDRLTPELELIAAGSALTLASIDVVYVARGRIRPVYLLDAVANLALAAGYAIHAIPPDPSPTPSS
jgi:hypothetical protein